MNTMNVALVVVLLSGFVGVAAQSWSIAMTSLLELRAVAFEVRERSPSASKSLASMPMLFLYLL